MKVSLRVKELSDARGWSAQDLASQSGLDAETVSHIYSGQSVEIDLTTLGALAQLFDVLPNELVDEVEEPQPSIIETGERPRSIHVPEQDLDDVTKGRSDDLDPTTDARQS
jgi:transcriptional regulator with XRE-family HTH domain